MTSSISSLKKQVAEREANTADLAKQLKGRGDAVDKLRADLAWAKSQLECLELLKHELELKTNEKTELSDKVAKLQVHKENFSSENIFHCKMFLIFRLRWSRQSTMPSGRARSART